LTGGQQPVIIVDTKMFTWDSYKAQLNYLKHGVSFVEALSCFEDQFGIEVDDIKHSAHERRSARFALSAMGRVLTVIFTIRRLGDGKETIRIISARQASRKEREKYSRFKDRL
jgi:uncharacterized DUF497 family protein